ncbi:MAG: sialate O-acetylesterase [Bacteroidales bacterium]|nr:sialate O-acetylesterase [Bacteroidales bacterium]
MRLSSLILLSSLATLSAQALTMPNIFSSNAVLQQQSDARLWGTATPGATVEVTTSWDGKTRQAVAEPSGRWDITVATPEASFTPYNIKVAEIGSNDTIALDNVLIGEVWLCSGQSNMEMPLRGFWTQPIEGAAQTIAYSGCYPGIRVAMIPKTVAYTPQDDVEGTWMESTPANAASFTALGYHFAQSLTRLLNVPVGIICNAYGGSKVEGWVPNEVAETYPDFNLAAEQADASKPDYERIAVMYNAMLHPIMGYTIKGMLWNQGESQVGKHDVHAERLAQMVDIWRQDWGQGELPFYFVEIPGWNYGNPEGTDAALLRESQHKAAEIIPNSAVVSAIDLIYPYELEDIHASRKQEIGERLAFTAASLTYGIPGIPYQSPTFRSMEVNGNQAQLFFDNADGGLTPNDVLLGFEAAGADRVFHPAQVTETWDCNIMLSCPDVDEIQSVRYCFKNFAIGSVYNMMGMPLVPFRTDDWDK